MTNLIIKYQAEDIYDITYEVNGFTLKIELSYTQILEFFETGIFYIKNKDSVLEINSHNDTINYHCFTRNDNLFPMIPSYKGAHGEWFLKRLKTFFSNHKVPRNVLKHS